MVAVEPSGAPDPDQDDVSALEAVPDLFVRGDHLDAEPLWRKLVPNVMEYRDALARASADVTGLDLPKERATGNSCMLTMDRNSDEIVGRVADWLAARGLVR